MTVDAETWPELMTAFVHFLNAASFHIDRDNINEWLTGVAPELPRQRKGRK